MSEDNIKDIIVALIEKGTFQIGSSNEETAIEIAKFHKAYIEEMNKE